MTPDSIDIAFFVSLLLGMGIGIALMVLWTIRFAYPRTMLRLQGWRRVNAHAVAYVAFFHMLPGLLVSLLCCVPLFHSAGLRKQVPYGVGLIRVNDLQRDDAILAERCSRIDSGSLFRMADRTP